MKLTKRLSERVSVSWSHVKNENTITIILSERGLPVIPFGQPSVCLPDREEGRERESHLKRLRRKSSDLKRELTDFRFLNRQVYFEEEEEEEGSTKDRTRSSSFNMVREPNN